MVQPEKSNVGAQATRYKVSFANKVIFPYLKKENDLILSLRSEFPIMDPSFLLDLFWEILLSENGSSVNVSRDLK